MKKAVAFGLLGLLIIVLAISACMIPSNGDGNGNGNGNENQTNETYFIMITDGMILDEDLCQMRGVKDKVIVFHSSGCPACSIAVPRLEELEQEMDYDFEFIDISNGRDRMMEIGLIPSHIPTVIIKCKVYVGAKSKEDYRNLIKG